MEPIQLSFWPDDPEFSKENALAVFLDVCNDVLNVRAPSNGRSAL